MLKVKFLLVLLLLSFWVTSSDAKPKSKFKTLNYLYHISGKKTIAGIHNREPNAKPAQWTHAIDSISGKTPGLWSGDFLFQQENIDNRSVMIDEAIAQWQKGAVVNIMWHSCNPALDEPCGWDKNGVLSHLSDEQWKELTTEGSPLNQRWKSRIDEISVFLQKLKDNGVEVLWRPMHEMNQGVFWWGGRPGPEGTVKFYQMLHDYLTNVKKLDNLIWVWDIQDFSTFATDVYTYKPESKYWDIAALDVYDDKSGYSKEKYNIMLSACEGKPIAIGECQKLPTVEQLKKQPKWTFFMCWSELEFKENTTEQIIAIHNSRKVITRDEMPGWK